MNTIRDAHAMIAGMSPVLRDGVYVFSSTVDADRMAALSPHAIATFAEPEGMSFILPVSVAQSAGLDCALPMRQISLTVFSALDGVGLTAAIAAALARHAIPCNMVAAFHHDHVFVPEALVDKAMDVLQRLQAEGATKA